MNINPDKNRRASVWRQPTTRWRILDKKKIIFTLDHCAENRTVFIICSVLAMQGPPHPHSPKTKKNTFVSLKNKRKANGRHWVNVMSAPELVSLLSLLLHRNSLLSFLVSPSLAYSSFLALSFHARIFFP